VLLFVVAFPLPAQRIDWHARATTYADNTEFFTPYRTGETILGGQLATWIAGAAGRQVQLRAGAALDRRWGSEAFADSVKPILAVEYRTRHSTGILGTLDNSRRFGLLDPVMVSTRELTTPVEYGGQWHERRGRLDGQAWLNWRKLNTVEQREEFEMGAVATVELLPWLGVHAQHLWSHRGGQLFDAGVPVTNNRVTAVGARVEHPLPMVRRGSAQVMQLWSDGYLDPDTPSDRPSTGHGTWLRLAAMPWRGVEIFGVSWWGRDFHAAAGDPNYGSPGEDPDFYRSERRYTELGALRRVRSRSGTELDLEIRWHRIDDESSEAFLGTNWELSYRVVARVPIAVPLRR
jgi:hypothetical protein